MCDSIIRYVKKLEETALFEQNYDSDAPEWKVSLGPDVQYQWNLETLGLIAPMLSEAFNREYEMAE